MGFECADGPFGLVATMHIGWNKLKRAFVGVCDGKFVSRACFVVEDLLFHDNVLGFEMRHALVVCWDAVMVGLGLEWFYQNRIGTRVVSQHDILVSAV
jgi:hypothetical protein